MAPTLPATARRRRIALPHGPDALLVIVLASLGVLLLVLLRSSFKIDSWLELVAGRQIWHAGIPAHETLTVMAHGARWIDQQWLAQLAAYAIYRVGGLGLVGVVNVALIVLGVGGAVWGARRLGGGFKAILLVFPLAMWFVIPAREVRTQAFAIPVFVAVAYLLAADSRRPSRRVYWCLPLLVVWGNLHGTVAFGAGLVALRGITLAHERRACWRAPSAWRRPLALVLLPALCLLASPYGVHIISYYQATLGNSALKRAVTEWQPITSDVVLAVPFFILLGIVIWSFGRTPKRTTSWEKIALLVLAAAGIDALRGALLFGLLALMLLPSSLEGLRITRRAGRRPDRDRLNAVLLGAGAAVLLVTIVATAARPAAYFDGGAPAQRALRAVERAARSDPALRVMADMRFADWLLWKDPELEGKVVADARFELLSGSDIDSIVRLVLTSGDWKRAAAGARLLVLDRKTEARAVTGFLSEPGSRVLYKGGEITAILRSHREAA